MADSAHDFQAYKRLAALENQVRTFGGGGSGGDNGFMEARVSALEEAVKSLPTKTDFAELRADIAKGQADMHKAIADNHRWTHTALVGMISVAVIGILGLLVTIWNAGKPHNAQPQPPTAQAPASQQPIIINIPSATPPTVVTSPQQ
ncbi:hypothetical protein LZ683_10400 [Comamonas testosteroni]|uniref:hypothetical protein n=1 Tax=Comamonas testosteroni TaxID=285 RepID=UPI0023AA64FE|nr:hypothetical protein [Comamonas testosteroni]WEE79733.1 hypothetical protein LZ683_10400 [Comamonas testosteroni]